MTVHLSNLGEACSRPACFAPQTACVLGQDECEYLVEPVAKAVETDAREGHVLPWSGGSLGLSDLFPIVATGRPCVVGVVGAPNSGKTTLLAAHWIAARRGMGSFGRAFAGSYSLSGWHQIARHLQWVPKGSGFPPHTSAVDERSPALLHITVARAAQQPKQVLYTDAPGEWFARWADVPAEAPGAQWIADHSDAFVLLADGDALSGPDRGVARGDYVALAHQLATAARGRPVIPVLTKADIEVPGTVLEQVEDLNNRLFGRETMKVSAHNSSFASITTPVDAGVEAAFCREVCEAAFRPELVGTTDCAHGPRGRAMSMVNGTNVLVLGGPSVGKTTFLMQLYGRVATEECLFRLRQAPESLTAIKDGWNRLQQGLPPGHTPHGTDTSLTLPVIDTAGRRIDITVPDYAGEDLRRIGEQRRFSDRWRNLAVGSDHWLLMMRLAQDPDIPDLITRPIGELASAGPTDTTKHNPSLPGDMLAVELLQVLLHTRMREQLPADREIDLTLVLSCWDELETPAGTKPGEVASKRVALLDSFCRSRWGARYRVYGLSSQGQELDEGTPAKEYLDLGPQKMGWLVDPAGSGDPDLTKLIALSE